MGLVGVKAPLGYGLALLLVFVASSVMIAASMSMTLAPTVATALGTVSMDGTSAKQVALVGLDAAENDIKTQLAAGTAVTTSYRYPASGTTNVTMPTYPGSGASATVGNYYVTVTKARGFTYMLKAVATVGSVVTNQYKLVQVNDSAPSIPTAANGASDPVVLFSLRRLLPSYGGSAVRVRCATTGTTTDIGFNGFGEFSLTQLRACLGDDTLPLDAVPTGINAAYSLRRLSSSYSGYAIQVRKSSNNALQDIGFDADGNLDTQALMSFIGSNSGYVKIWYDQSGNGKNVSQSTNSKQPRVVNAGVLETANNAPTVKFIRSSSTTLTTNSAPLAANTGKYTFLVVSQVFDNTNNNSIVSQETATPQNGKRACFAALFNGKYGFVGENNDNWLLTTPVNTLFQSSMSINNSQTNNLTLYQNGNSGTAGPTTDRTTLQLGNAGLAFGSKYSDPSSAEYMDGYLSEVIIYSSPSNLAMSTTDRQSIEHSQGHYFNVSGMQDGFVTTWYDQSGNGRNATQATAANQPSISQTGMMAADGTIRPAVMFDGSSDYLATAASTAWPSGSSNRTMNALYRLNQATWRIIFGWGSIGTGLASFASVDIGFWGYSADVYTGLTSDTNYGHRIAITKSGSTVNVYRDGVSKVTGTPSLNTTSNTILTIGADNGGPGNLLVGNEAEVILYNTALNGTKLSQLETSQTNYYGQ